MIFLKLIDNTYKLTFFIYFYKFFLIFCNNFFILVNLYSKSYIIRKLIKKSFRSVPKSLPTKLYGEKKIASKDSGSQVFLMIFGQLSGAGK